MALVVSSQPVASTRDPTALLTQAVAQFETTLTSEQRANYHKISTKPDASDVIAFVTQVDCQNQVQARRCVASRLCTFLDAVQQFTGVVGTFVSSNPAIAALLWGSVKFTIVAASSVASYFDKVTSMIMSIGKLCPVYKQFGQLFANSASLQLALCDYYAAIVRLCIKVMEVSQRTALQQLFSSVWNSFELEFKTCREELQQATEYVNLHIRLASKQAEDDIAKLSALEHKENQKHRSLTSAFRAETRKEHEDAHRWRLHRSNRMASKLRSRIRDNLSTIDYLKTWKHFYQQRAPSTAEWLQDDPRFVDWRNAKVTTVIWCPGTLGIGKTVLASNVVAHLQRTRDSKDMVCYHFCDSQDRASLSARMILGTLARQIMSSQIELASGDELDHLMQQTRYLEAEDVIEFLLPHFQDDHKYYIVLDGLDEIDSDDIRTVAWSIARLCKERVMNLKFMCTGRPELEQHLFRWKRFDHKVAITKSILMGDIDRYSEAALYDCLEEGKLVLNDPTLILRISETLKGVSEGIFLWTKMFIEEMCAQQSDNEILEALENPPRKISQLIDRKLARIRGQDAASQALKMLKFCGVLKKPLEVNEYQELLSLSIGQESFDRGRLPNNMIGIVAACCGLVFIDAEDSTIHYIHQSIRQYLFSSTDPDTSEFAERDLDTYVGELCLTYLDLNDFQRQLIRQRPMAINPIHPAQFGFVSTMRSSPRVARAAQKLLKHRRDHKDLSVRDLEQKVGELSSGGEPSRLISELQSREFCFLKYAGVYWIDHLRQLDAERNARSWPRFCKLVTGDNSLLRKPWATEGDRRYNVSRSHYEIDDIVDWSIKKGHPAVLHCMLFQNPKALTDQASAKVLYCDAAVPPLHPQLVSVIVNRTKCRKETLIDGLLHAAASGHGDCVDVYLSSHVPIDSTRFGATGKTALQYAVIGGHLDIVDKLLVAGANVNISFESGIDTTLNSAVVMGRLDIVDRLLLAGAHVDAGIDYGQDTALNCAALRGYFDIAERLLVAGATVNNRDYNFTQRTALQAAIMGGHVDIVERLIVAGADVNIKDGDHTPLLAAVAGGHLDIVERLLVAGANVDTGIEFGHDTALQSATKRGHLDIVEKLLVAGANVNIGIESGHGTALQSAAHGGHLQIVERLLAAGANVNAGAEHDLDTALVWAARRDHLEITDRLLLAGADVNAGMESGNDTALHVAARRGRLDVVERLLAAGANVNGHALATPLRIATTFGHSNVAQMLRDSGGHE